MIFPISETSYSSSKSSTVEIIGSLCARLIDHKGRYVDALVVFPKNRLIFTIPFVALPKELGYSIVRECHQCMKKGGRYIQVHYSLLTKKLYETVFGNVDINWIPLNVPPAFVLVSEKV